MQRLFAAVTLALLLLARPFPARAEVGPGDAGLALGAAAVNIIYTPVKAIVAAGGLMLGGVVGVLSGGDQRSAYALWVPAAGGSFFVTPKNLDGSEPLEFFGSDYADRPSPYTLDAEEATMYDAIHGVTQAQVRTKATVQGATESMP